VERNTTNSSYEVNIILIPKVNKDETKKRITDKDLQQNTGKQNSTTFQKDHTP
jgi:hypothetical protein